MNSGKKLLLAVGAIGACAIPFAFGPLAYGNANPTNVLTGEAAFASHTNVKPGVWRHITAKDLPKPVSWMMTGRPAAR